MLVGLFAYLSIAFLIFLESPSALPSPSLDVASTVRQLAVGVVMYIILKLIEVEFSVCGTSGKQLKELFG